MDDRAYAFGNGYTGYPDYHCLPNLLKKFNPKLAGYSIGTGDAYSSNAKLNVAVDGAQSGDFWPQVSHLRNKLKDYSPEAWKHISIFIGGNDLCVSCTNVVKYSPANFQANMEAVLDDIKATIPKVFISIITPPDITIFNFINTGRCIILEPFVCGCKKNAGTKNLQKLYSRVLHDIEALPKYNDKEDFFISVQPFLEDIQLPLKPDRTPDLTYFALDCFHLSSKGHSAFGQALWNNLMEPLDNKTRTWVVGEPFICPGPDQYLQ